jgi:hypothetical protein
MHSEIVILFRQHCGPIVTISQSDGAGPKKPRTYFEPRFRPKSVSHIRSEICEAFDRPSGW